MEAVQVVIISAKWNYNPLNSSRLAVTAGKGGHLDVLRPPRFFLFDLPAPASRRRVGELPGRPERVAGMIGDVAARRTTQVLLTRISSQIWTNARRCLLSFN